MDVRRIQEEAARTRLRVALRVRGEAYRRMEEAVEDCRAWDSYVREECAGDCAAGRLGVLLEGSRHHRRKVQQAAEEVKRTEKAVEERREDLLESKRKLEPLERLYERDFWRYQAWAVSHEQRFLDEVGLRRHGRECVGQADRRKT